MTITGSSSKRDTSVSECRAQGSSSVARIIATKLVTQVRVIAAKRSKTSLITIIHTTVISIESDDDDDDDEEEVRLARKPDV